MVAANFVYTCEAKNGALPEWNARLNQQLLEHSCLIFRGVALSEKSQLLQFAETVGEPVEYAFGKLFELRDAGAGKRTQLSNRPMCIHQDSVLPDTFADIVLMYCWAAPSEGGEALICDNRRFLALLHEKDPELFEFFVSARVRYNNHTGDYYAPGEVEAAVIKATTRVHPILGVRLPYFAAHDVDDPERNYTAAFEGVPPDKSDELMRRIDHWMRSEDVKLEHRPEKGDLIIFDNLLVSHGRNGFPAGQVRALTRVQLKRRTSQYTER